MTVRSRVVKDARRLTRRVVRARERRFLAEGPQAVREALAVPGCVQQMFVARGCAQQHPDLVRAAEAAGVAWRSAPDAVLDALAQTVTTQGVVAVCGFLDRPVEQVLAPGAALIVLCADVRDPGNAGTVLRCADAAGADGVVFAGSSVDPYNPKAVRATAGSLFHLPVAVGVSVAEAIDLARERGMTVLAADGDGDQDLFELEDTGVLRRPSLWVFGNEAHGLPSDLAARADRVVRIPILGRAESLNLATAAAVCLYSSARARR